MRTASPDIDILKRIQADDPQALTRLFDKYYQQLCSFLSILIPQREIVEELTANVFINLWKNRHKADIQTSIRSYLYSSAKNQATSFLRKKKKETSFFDFDFFRKKDKSPETIFIENELELDFNRAFRKVPPRAKLAFRLHRFDGLKYREIADIMEISVSAVEKNIATALQTLILELEKSVQPA